MTAATDITVKTWSELTTTEVYALARLRTEVFLREQQCDDEELDWRDLEPTTGHYLILDGTGPAVSAYLRVLVNPVAEVGNAHLVIGRVVTGAGRRGEGLAGQLLTEVVARHGGEPMMLHAQTYAAGLYARFGFETVGEEFDEGGIPHITMVRAAD
jgi:ElaA protein